MTALTFDRVDVALAKRTVLSDISIAFAPGELVGVMGPNGSGKTTLMRAAAGLADRTAGTVTILDRPLGAWRPEELGRALAYPPCGR